MKTVFQKLGVLTVLLFFAGSVGLVEIANAHPHGARFCRNHKIHCKQKHHHFWNRNHRR